VRVILSVKDYASVDYEALGKFINEYTVNYEVRVGVKDATLILKLSKPVFNVKQALIDLFNMGGIEAVEGFINTYKLTK